MKLYTEEKLRQSFIAVDPLKYEQDANEYMDLLTPIELPSDEEIEKEVEDYLYKNNKMNFINGAKWMKEQIINQNK